MVVVPFMVATFALIVFGALGVKEPLWAYLAFFVSFDVAHVWATAYLTYFDAASFRKRKWLYSIPIPAFFIGAFLLHLASPMVFWSGVAYFAIVHFAKQQYGFIAIYKAKYGERDPLDYKLDKFTLWTGAFGPVLIWHAQPRGQFDWWDNGERFLLKLPEQAQWVIAVIMIVCALLYIARQVQLYQQTRTFNFGKNLWMLASWISWTVGLMFADNLLVSAAFINLFHGLPFLVLVWRRGKTKYKERTKGFARWVFHKKNWLIFYGIIIALALVEESAWDALVWHTYTEQWLGKKGIELSHLWLSLTVAALSTPQLVHYFLDAFLWKFNKHNDDLPEALGFAPRTSESLSKAEQA